MAMIKTVPAITFAALLVCGAACLIAPHAAAQEGETEEACTLDPPQTVFAKGDFKLDKRVAREVLRLDRDVVVQLEQTQCEYRTLTYTFIAKGAPEDTDVSGWQYRRATELLAMLEARSVPKLKFAAEKKALKAYEQLVADAKPDVDINIRPPHDQFQELISVSAHVSERDTRIIVRIVSGPY